MRISDLFTLSLDNLRRRKGRTVLTVIGVVVGVCAIVVMVSLGIAVNQATDAMLQSWGDLTKITVNSYGAQMGTPDLDDKMVAQFKEIPHVMAATPLFSSNNVHGQILGGRNNKYEAYGQVLGIDPESVGPMGYTIVTGTTNITQHLGKNKIPVLVGDQVIFNFYNPKKRWTAPDYQMYPKYDENYMSIMNLPQYDAEGNLLNPEEFFFDIMKFSLTYRIQIGTEESGEAKYKEYELVPVGMISGGNSDYQISNGIIMSIENIKKIDEEYKKLTKSSGGGGGGYSGGYVMYGGYGGGGENTTNVGGYDQVYVKVDNAANMTDVETTIKKIGYQIYSMSETRQQLQGQVAQTQMMLGGLAAVSLLVAALNIMNTMTMAIYERTKEIGVMKVLGCKLGDIRSMFLIESGAIGFVGGLVGVVVSLILAFLLNNLPRILAMMGVEGTVDIAGLFGLGGMSDMMGDMQLAVVPVWLVLLALGFATGVGILSGIAPANRAMKISSLEAIRHE